MKLLNHTSAALIIAGIWSVGCSSTAPVQQAVAPNDYIDNVAKVVSQAAAEPRVARFAPNELQRAQATLQSAQSTWQATGDMTQSAHLAYLANQRAVTAMELANQRAAEEAVVLGAIERETLVTASRGGAGATSGR